MRHHRLVSALTLLGTTFTGSLLWADTPVKPVQASFSSTIPASRIPPTQTLSVSQAEKLVQFGEMPAFVEKKSVIDYVVKAASIEVAWLQDASTYPLHLRAENKLGEESITLTGYVPSERLREKALFIAKMTVGNLMIRDLLTVHPQMALPDDMPVEPDQARIVQSYLEKAVPGIGKALQLSVDANGVATVTGRVDEFSDRLKLIRALQGIPGCTAIRYDLRVPAPVQQVGATTTPPAAIPNVSVPPAKVPAVKVEPPVPPAKLQAPPPATQDKESNIKTALDISASTVASAIVQAGCTEPLVQQLEKVETSSLSGLIPPGMSGRTIEPGIMLGSPIIVRTNFEINLDVMTTTEKNKSVATSEISQTSTLAPVTSEPAPVLINVMPRLAK